MNISPKLLAFAMILASCVTSLFMNVMTVPSYQNATIQFQCSSHGDGTAPSSSYDSRPYYDSTEYVPATFEEYVHRNSEYLGLTNVSFSPSGCYLWGYDDASYPYGPSEEEKKYLRRVPDDVRQQYLDHLSQMDQYQAYIDKDFNLSLPPYVGSTNKDDKEREYSDLRHALRHYNHSVVCDPLQIPWGGKKIDSTTSTLSHITYSESGNLGDIQNVEPLLPQLRHASLCVNKQEYLMNMKYMVHDFRFICRTLTPHSRTIFVDMGGSLLFHGGRENPAISIASLYQQFGIIFDHVYAFEMTPFTPDQVKSIFKSSLPKPWETSYHWINVGVESSVDSKLNPFTMIKEHFRPVDLVVVKLDIDTSSVEVPLVQQLLNDPQLHTLIDQFYFEYHVKLKELNLNWGVDLDYSIYDAIHTMTLLREKGIAAHFWV